MKIVVTGNSGQIASSLVAATSGTRDVQVVAIGRPELELRDKATIFTALARERPDIVVSAAAYTEVDKAEDDQNEAFAVNADGAANVAAAAEALNVPVFHFSTDYVFNGTTTVAYDEDMAPAPQSVYGLSKYAGEKAVASENPRHLILRTAWVYSVYGKNFVKSILRLAEQRDQIAVVADQWGNPTSADDIADAVLQAARAIQREDFCNWGIFHLAGTGEANWSDFARHILNTSQTLGGPYAHVVDISSAEYPTKALRPLNSRLTSSKFSTTFGWRSPHWRNSSEKIVTRLISGST